MKKNFKDESEIRSFLMNHIFYPTVENEAHYIFDYGYFGKLSGEFDQLTKRDELSMDKFDVDCPYAIVKHGDGYALIDGRKVINDHDSAFEIEIGTDSDVSISIGGNDRPSSLYYLRLISVVNNQLVVDLYTNG